MAFLLCDKGKALSLFGGGAGNYSSFILTPPFNKANLEPELSFDLEIKSVNRPQEHQATLPYQPNESYLHKFRQYLPDHTGVSPKDGRCSRTSERHRHPPHRPLPMILWAQ
jgi:hypothetical protein